MRLRFLRVAAALGIAAACDVNPSDGGGGNCTPTATRVCMTGSSFSPANLTVTIGTTVRWVNNDAETHTVESATGAKDVFHSEDLTTGTGFAHVFDIAGTNPYYCRYHGANDTPPTGMSGTITVTP